MMKSHWSTCLLMLTACAGELEGATDGPAGVVPPGPGIGDVGPAPADPCAVPQVGPRALLRLSSLQFHNSVRDLFGVTVDQTPLETADERVGAFVNNSRVPVTELLVEQYAGLAEDAASQAVPALLEQLDCVAQDAECIRNLVVSVGRRAYRRPLSDVEISRYLQVFGSASNFADGLELVVSALLQSPNFLYHVETNGAAAPTVSPVRIDDYRLAARLSFALHNSVPDDALLDAAANGTLATPDGVLAQAVRLLDAPQAAGMVGDFHRQWLHLDALATLEKDPTAFPEFDSDLASAMVDDVAQFADYVIRSADGRFATLMTGAFTFAQGPLLDLYGVASPGIPGQPLALDPAERAGLVTQPAFLAMAAHAEQSSPIQRGVVVRENLLCQTLPPPPPDVDNTPPEVDPNATTRERFAQHTASPPCAGCHQLIDPIGLGLENYDAIGRYRTTENGLPIDASGKLTNAGDADGPFVGGVELGQRLANSQAARECVASQWFQYLIARPEHTDDACSVQSVYDRFAETDFNLRELVLALIQSDAFSHTRGPSE